MGGAPGQAGQPFSLAARGLDQGGDAGIGVRLGQQGGRRVIGNDTSFTASLSAPRSLTPSVLTSAIAFEKS